MKKSLIMVVIFLLLFIAVFSWSILCLPDGKTQVIISQLSLQFIGGFLLALAVFILGMVFEEKRKSEIKTSKLIENQEIIKNLLMNAFDRGESKWNFSNGTPTFYFDIGWINPLYDLLIQKNRSWEVHLKDYLGLVDDKNQLVIELNEFIKLMDKALINAEKLDNKLKFSKIGPSLAASMESGFLGDRVEAKKDAEFGFWIYRAFWAGANPTEIMFGYSFFTPKQLDIERIKSMSDEALRLAKDNDYKSLIIDLRKDQKQLTEKVGKIKRLARQE